MSLWDEMKRVREATRLMEIAAELSGRLRLPGGHPRVARLHRRALRMLNGGAPADLEPVAAGGLAVAPWEALERRRAALGLRGWFARHRSVLLGRGRFIFLATGALLVVLVAAVPAFRRLWMPPDLAAGKPWVASTAIPEFAKTGVVVDDDRVRAMFHTAEEPSPSVVIDLGALEEIRQVRVTNRLDCCGERTVPLVVEVSGDGKSWRRVGYRRLQFRSWTAQFRATPARLVRLRVDRRSILHLQTVSVY